MGAAVLDDHPFLDSVVLEEAVILLHLRMVEVGGPGPE